MSEEEILLIGSKKEIDNEFHDVSEPSKGQRILTWLRAFFRKEHALLSDSKCSVSSVFPWFNVVIVSIF